MFSSKVKNIKSADIKQHADELADSVKEATVDLAADVQTAMQHVVDGSKKTAGKAGARLDTIKDQAKDEIGTQSQQVKTGAKGLLSRISALINPENRAHLNKLVTVGVDAAASEAVTWTAKREEQLAQAIRLGSHRTRTLIHDKPFASVAVAMGVGALLTYWLTKRPIAETAK